MKAFFLIAACAVALGACHHAASEPEMSIGPRPIEHYVCEGGTGLAVQLLGETASVSVDGAPAEVLTQLNSSANVTTFSNGRHVVIISGGAVSYAPGRAMPAPCSAAGS